MNQLEQMHRDFLRECQLVSSTQAIESLRVRYLGRKGVLQETIQLLRSAPKEEKPRLGQAINALKNTMTSSLEEVGKKLQEDELEERLQREAIDTSLPGRRNYRGNRHILHHMLDSILDVLSHMGFSVHYGSVIENDWYNFAALNFPPEHPARDMQDTFHLEEEFLLRTHTSNVQIRMMEQHRPPIRIVSPGKCFRNDDISSRSHLVFHQIEAFYIDKNVSLGDLLATLEMFLHHFLQQKSSLRIRPSYFPFVEPGLEVDVRCLICKGKGCSICKQSGWLEILGAGLIHSHVLKNVGIDPEEYSGFAWGLGIERLAMIRYGIDDIRLFTENDRYFLQQFRRYSH